MTLMTIARQAEKLVADNSPQILTAIGVAGTITTAILTGKAAVKADRLIMEAQFKNGSITVAEDSKNPVLTTRQKVELTWKLYIPAATTCVLTVACIITASQVGTRRAAAMASAYAVSEKAFSQYKEEVRRKFGDAKAQAVQDDLAQHQVNENPVSSREVIIAGSGNVLCYEPFTDRYFMSDAESLKKAMNDLNYRINNDGYASLSEFYDLVGLARTSYSDEVGWSSDKLLDLVFSTVLSADSRPCLSFTYKVEPIRNYYRVH